MFLFFFLSIFVHIFTSLGTSYAGKSTLFKQFQILGRKEPFDTPIFKPVIYRNILKAMKTLMDQACNLAIDLQNPDLSVLSQKLATIGEEDNNKEQQALELFTPEFGQELKKLWNDSGIQQTFAHRSEFNVLESIEYFMSQIDRIAALDYTPSIPDVLRSRQRTDGVMEFKFSVDGVKYHVIDVSSHSRKWFRLFDKISLVVHIIDVSDYDHASQGEEVNRVSEALNLFEDISKSKHFKGVPVLALLNKKDLFEQKIKEIDLKVCFSDYQGGCNYDAAISYLREKLITINSDKNRQLTIKETCAVDESEFKQLCPDIFKTINNNN